MIKDYYLHVTYYICIILKRLDISRDKISTTVPLYLYSNKNILSMIVKNRNKAIAMMRRKSPPSENNYFIENLIFQTNISKGIRRKGFSYTFFHEIKLYFVYMSQ